jgi:hypothetical protein
MKAGYGVCVWCFDTDYRCKNDDADARKSENVVELKTSLSKTTSFWSTTATSGWVIQSKSLWYLQSVEKRVLDKILKTEKENEFISFWGMNKSDNTDAPDFDCQWDIGMDSYFQMRRNEVKEIRETQGDL